MEKRCAVLLPGGEGSKGTGEKGSVVYENKGSMRGRLKNFRDKDIYNWGKRGRVLASLESTETLGKAHPAGGVV